MRIGIVGAEEAKFTGDGEARAIVLILRLLQGATHVVSGHCHLGGIDILAEEIGTSRGLEPLIFPPLYKGWASYKARNILIAHNSDILHNIVVDRLPPGFSGMTHKLCYHCGTTDHVKSGGCWTAKYALKIGVPAIWHVIQND